MAAYSPDPFRSLATQGCIESGKDFLWGGPIYNHGQILTEGLADTADSLTAIRHFVYDTKEISMATLLDALKKDFAGYEPLRLKLDNYGAKFGNDIDEADQTAADIQKYFFTVLSRYHTWRDPINGQYGGGLSTFQRTGRYGRAAAAAANGRHCGDVFIADSIGATPGRDRLGPTAALCSAMKYDHTLATSGFVMQLKFDKAMFATEEGIENFISLVKGYFQGGGQQLTINVVDQEELLDAKLHPERHQNLIVRVGGYSAYFTQLEVALQDNIIARTMHNV
jgi:formate C-acetyltransferase